MIIASSLTPDTQALLDRLQSALADFRADPADTNRQRALSDARRQLAEALAVLPKRETQGDFARAALGIIRKFSQHAAQDIPVSEGTLAWASEKARSGPAGLLAAMTLVSAAQLPAAPTFDDVPDWLWGDYATWLFAAPGDTYDASNTNRVNQLRSLTRWIERNPAAQCVREASNAYLTSPAVIDRTLSNDELALRGRILSALFLRNVTRYASTPLPRDGRPLKIGFIAQNFAPTNEAQSLRPLFELSDFSRTETHLFTLEPADDAFAQLCITRGHTLQTLPSSADEQLSILRAVGLDVLIYFRDRLVQSMGDITRLALHRIAPLQVAYSPSGKITGLPEIDLVMAPRSTAPAPAANIGERIGVLPLDMPVYVIRPAPEPTDDFSRQALGIADDTTVYVSAIDGMVATETRRAWARILAETPGSILILQQTEQPLDAQASAAVAQSFIKTLAEAGVAADRFALSDFRDRAEMLATLRLGDVYLEPLANAAQRWTAEALALGLPVIAGLHSAPLLKAANAPEWIARDSAEYIRAAIHAGTHAEERRQAATQIRETVENYAEFTDTLGATDACCALLETVYDGLHASGHAIFRRSSALITVPVADNSAELLQSGQAALDAEDSYQASLLAADILKSTPCDANARLLYGRSLLKQGNAPRALAYLLPAVQLTPSNASGWYSLAQALHMDLQTADAIGALETCLRLDDSHTDAWLLLAELAENAGALDLVRDAVAALKQLSPNHPQVADLAQRFAN